MSAAATGASLARVGDIDIAYEVQGEGPPLLLIAGFTASRHHWLGFDQRLAATRRVVSFDNRGVGESSSPQPPYEMSALALDALGLLDALGIDRVDIVGTSMGGMIALEIALLAPSRVRGLVLACTSGGGALHHLPPFDLPQLFTPAKSRDPRETLARIFAANLSARFIEHNPALIESLIDHSLANRMARSGFLGQLSALASFAVEPRLPQLAAPTLLVTGTDDALMPPENTDALAARIAGAQVVRIEGAGHMFWIEQQELAASHIDAFLRSVSL